MGVFESIATYMICIAMTITSTPPPRDLSIR